jgi:hypothetical protein
MKRIKDFIYNNIQGKKVLFFFVVTNLVYVFMLFVTIPKVMSYSNGMKIPDLMPTGYNTDHINTLFTILGTEGRNVYLYNQIPADMVYPLLFAICYSLLLAYLFKKLNILQGVFLNLCLLPVIAGVSDYIENFGIIAMLNSFPNISDWLVNLTNVFTIIKSMNTTIYFVVLIITLVALGLKRIKDNGK